MNKSENLNDKRFFTRPSYDSNSKKRLGVLSTYFALKGECHTCQGKGEIEQNEL
jgi:hypothetical protein